MDQRGLVSKIAESAGLTDLGELERVLEATAGGLGKALSARLFGKELPELASADAFYAMIAERAQVPLARTKELVKVVCSAMAEDEPTAVERLGPNLPPEIGALLVPRAKPEGGASS